MKFLLQIWRAHLAQSYRILFIVSCCVICVLPTTARALVVTEIMYDAPGTDTSREWIEIYNESADLIALQEWKLFESNSNHGISSVRGDGIIAPGEYVVVGESGTSFVSEYGSYSGDVYDSSFSLSNEGEPFSFRTSSGTYSAEASYVGGVLASGDGNSLHWIDGKWVARLPNPGLDPGVAQSGSVSGSQNTTDNNSNSSSSSGNSLERGDTSTGQYNPVYTMSATIWPLHPIARSPFTITPKVVRTLRGESVEYTIGIVRVITGDGREIISSTTNPIEFTYDIPGKYRLIVEYSQSALVKSPLARYSVDIQVSESTVAIGVVNNIITLTNESQTEIDLSSYRIVAGDKSITIARDTVLLAGAGISVGGSRHILESNPESISLIMPDGKTVVSRMVLRKPFTVKPKTKRDRQSYSEIEAVALGSDNIVKPVVVSGDKDVPESTFLKGVRDPSLIVPAVLEVDTRLSQNVQPVQTSVIVDSVHTVTSDKDQSDSRSGYSGIVLVISTVVSLSVISISLLYILNNLKSQGNIAVESDSSVKDSSVSNNSHYLGSVNEYIIVDRV